MRILTVDNEADLAVLRSSSTNFNVADLNTAEYAALARKLVKTLESTDGGVGFAAVIFQHECDHLDGVIYTDKAENVVPDND